MQQTDRGELERLIGHRFADPSWLERALTHSTYRQEYPAGELADNEALEFLGDAVLGLAVSEALTRAFPEWSAGQLSRTKARLVSAPALAAAARRLRLGSYLRMGRGEEKTGGREKETLLADAYEAVVAAVYSDAGLPSASAFVERTLLDEALRAPAAMPGPPDPKSALQEFLQARGLPPADYRVVREYGPDHSKVFRVEVRVAGELLGVSEGTSKKKAEQLAARLALDALRARTPQENS